MMMTDLSSTRPIDRRARSAHSERRCTAHRKNGDQCKNAARHGTNVRDLHGAKASQVKCKARQRIEEAADRMACELLKTVTDANVADSVKLAAIRDALDRAKNAVEEDVGRPRPYELVLETIEAGSRAEYRRSMGIADVRDTRAHALVDHSRELGATDGCVRARGKGDHVKTLVGIKRAGARPGVR